jgi:hypothetical protein
MRAMFRVSRGESGFDGGTIDDARDLVRGEQLGRYHADETRAELFRSGHTSRAWGSLNRHADGERDGDRRDFDRFFAPILDPLFAVERAFA